MNPSGSIIFPRDVISELQSKPELLALMTVLVARARFKATESERGQSLKPGQALAGKRELSRLFGWSESRAYRALKRLQSLDLIELTSDRRGSVVTVSDWSSYSRLPKRKRTNSETMSNQNLNAGEPTAKRCRTQTKAEGTKKRNPSSLPDAGKKSLPDPKPISDDWRRMEEEISKRGVSLAKQAVSTLRKNGCSLDLAQQVLDHFDKGNGCWNAGALFVRLQALHTDQDPASHWPPQAVTRTQVEQSAYAYLDKRDTAREALLAEQRAEQQRVQDLETKHGDVIDMLDKDGIKELIKQAYPEQTDFHLVRFRRSGLTAAFRYELLVYLESRNGSDMTEI